MAVHEACGREMADALRKYRACAAFHGKELDGSRKGTVKLAGFHRKSPQTNRAKEVAVTNRSRPTAVTTAEITTATIAEPRFGKCVREAAWRDSVADLERVPVSWRAHRWLTVKRRAEEKSQAEEARAMFMAEIKQRHVDR